MNGKHIGELVGKIWKEMGDEYYLIHKEAMNRNNLRFNKRHVPLNLKSFKETLIDVYRELKKGNLYIQEGLYGINDERTLMRKKVGKLARTNYK